MNIILTVILVLIINVMSRVLTEKIKDIKSLIKLKKELKNDNQFDINQFDINKNFWGDLNNEDISTERDNK